MKENRNFGTFEKKIKDKNCESKRIVLPNDRYYYISGVRSHDYGLIPWIQ